MRSLKQFFLSLFILALPSTLISNPAYAASGDVANGEEVYQKRCSQCHGESGAADGAAATRGYPRPRPFANNTMFKIRTTPVGALPTDDDLFNIIVVQGLELTQMQEIVDASNTNLTEHITPTGVGKNTKKQ